MLFYALVNCSVVPSGLCESFAGVTPDGDIIVICVCMVGLFHHTTTGGHISMSVDQYRCSAVR